MRSADGLEFPLVCHPGLPRSGKTGTHAHGGWRARADIQIEVFMGPGLRFAHPG